MRAASRRAASVDALVYGLMCIPKLIVLALRFLRGRGRASSSCSRLLMLICKIPFLGPLLFIVVFPLSVVVAGVTIVRPLSLPGPVAARDLAGRERHARARTDFRDRQEQARRGGPAARADRLSLASRSGSSSSASSAPGWCRCSACRCRSSASAALGMESLMTMSQGGGGYAVAGAIGGALLWAVAASLVGQVYLLGLSLVYLRVTEGLDLTASEEALRATFDDAQRRTTELGEKARQATQARLRCCGRGRRCGRRHCRRQRCRTATALQRAARLQGCAGAVVRAERERSLPPAGRRADDASAVGPAHGARSRHRTAVRRAARACAAGTFRMDPVPRAGAERATLAGSSAAAPDTTCPQCLSPVTSEDTFCGVCGYRLK